MTNGKRLSRTCPICDYSEGTVLHTQRFALSEGHPLQNAYDVVICNDCGFCFADTAVTQAEYDAYYARMSKYANSRTSTGAGVLPWDTERLAQMADHIAAFAPDRQARLLDIGCANGGLLMALAARGYVNTFGIDPSGGCVAQTRKVGAREAWEGTLSRLPAGIGPFDGIVLSHVLEHVRDLGAAMERLRGLLKPAGWIYVEVPNAMQYEEFLASPFQDFNTEHINHFSDTSLANLCRRHGFTPESNGTKRIYSAQDVPYPAVYWFARLGEKPLAISKDQTLGPALVGYKGASLTLMATIDRHIQVVLNQYSDVIVWGTGQLTMKLLVETCLRDAHIVAFVDENPVNQGQILRGQRVVSGAEIPSHTTPILVCSTINSAAIIKSIRERGLTNPIATLEQAADRS